MLLLTFFDSLGRTVYTLMIVFFSSIIIIYYYSQTPFFLLKTSASTLIIFHTDVISAANCLRTLGDAERISWFKFFPG